MFWQLLRGLGFRALEFGELDSWLNVDGIFFLPYRNTSTLVIIHLH